MEEAILIAIAYRNLGANSGPSCLQDPSVTPYQKVCELHSKFLEDVYALLVT